MNQTIISSSKNTDLSRNELPADKEILAALNSKKLIDCTLLEIEKVVIPGVSGAFALTGKKNDAVLSDNLKVIYNTLPTELKKDLPNMRLNEIAIAIKKTIYGEFGEYYGINTAELVRLCKAHYDSEARINTVKSILKPEDKPTLPPSLETQFFTAKNNTVTAYTKNQVGGNFETMAASCYDFVNKLRLIIFSKKEKYHFMKEAASKLISETNLKLSVIPEDYNRRPLKAFIAEIENWLNEDKIPTELTYAKIIAKSKFLTLKAFFHEIQESELDISLIIDNKKFIFVR